MSVFNLGAGRHSQPLRWACRRSNVILVEHPIQPLTRDEVRQRAETVFDHVVEKLTAG